MREFDFIKRIKTGLIRPANSIIKGIGDDCAILPYTAKKDLIITSDTLVENIHFSRKYFKPYEIGARAMSVNISDICAMGGTPRYALINIGFPASIKESYIDLIYKGITEYADNYGADIIGGDTVSSPNLILTITLVGDVEKGKALRRDKAKPGDSIFVTGTLGDSFAGLKILSKKRRVKLKSHEYMAVKRHLVPQPAFIEGRLLLKSNLINGCMDVSDGIVSDIHRICEESNVGAEIWAEKLPISYSAGKTAHMFGDSATHYALYGGEDCVLLFTVAKNNVNKFKIYAKKNALSIFEVGLINDSKIVKLTDNGKLIKEEAGKIWNHF